MRNILQTNDDTRDLAINILDELLEKWLIRDIKDSDDEYHFELQDAIHEVINMKVWISEEK